MQFLNLPLLSNQTDNFPNIDELWDYNNPLETEKKLLALTNDSNIMAAKEYYAELLTQLARTQSLQHKFDEAHAYLDSALKIMEPEMYLPQTRYFLERGRTYNSAGMKTEASVEFLKAYDMALKSGLDYYAIDAAHMLGISESPDQQIVWNNIALEIAEKSVDPKARKWLGSLYNNMGWTYHDLGDYNKALFLFEKALVYRQEQEDENGIFIAKWTIARNYRSMHEIETALAMQKELLTLIENGEVEPDGYVYEEIGECLLLLELEQESKMYFKRAYELLSKDEWLKIHESSRLDRLMKLSH